MKHKQLRNKKNLKLSSLKLIILLIILFIGFTLSGKYTGFFIYNETNLTEQNITGNQVLNDTSQINISVNEDNVIEYSNITNDTELIDSIEENITIINETENINEYSNVTDNLELNNTKIINESIKKIKEGKSFNLNEKVKDDKGNEVAKKIKDDKNFDVFFIDVIKSDKLYLQFYHNSDETQPIWIEGDINYELSDKEAIGYQMINLSVDLVNREVPNFKLHIGKESEVFEFGITIINVHSFPSLYGNWTVMFNTTGTADLKITATIDTNYTNEYTRWSDNSEDSDLYDLRFLEIKCGDIILNYEWQGTNCNENECSVFISNYSCNETAYEISRVLKAREHVLKFEFGDDSAFAYNANSNPVVSNVVLNSTTNGTCGALYSNLTVAFDVSDADGNNTKNITNWYLNNKSIQLLNLPFEGGSLSGTTNGVIGGTKDYSGLGYTITVNNVTWNPTGGYDG
ncbi:MAG: hypothetical protein KKD48_00975, partial [Nanoarchaeota archaeon]|nr:hypothetical protein [Nanoarchaeota archaeon]